MSLYEAVRDRREGISVIGLGYVGLPLAIAFARVAEVVGFDIAADKVRQYLAGRDVTKEVGDEAVRATTALLTWDEAALKKAKFHIIAVPTPINEDKTPDLRPVIGASHTLGRNLTKGSIVVYESTVYPGVTEDICVPILEAESGLACGVDFKIGYSPERINPGDKVHRLETITKIVSGMDEEALDDIANIYGMVVSAGVYRAESIKVAEAAKVIENAQRDINIAYMNELAIIFNRMGIDTKEVLAAAATKWNFLNFTPGLVGGHCIGIDPYYLTYRAEQLGYQSQIILAGRRINDGMGKYIAEITVKNMIKAQVLIATAKVGILGLTFKENCPDIRNTRVVDILSELREYGIEALVSDPEANPEEAKREYGIDLQPMSELTNLDVLIIAVAHEAFKEMALEEVGKLFKSPDHHDRIIVDVKGILDKAAVESRGYRYWRL